MKSSDSDNIFDEDEDLTSVASEDELIESQELIRVPINTISNIF
jgi:hypothetical protein